MNKNHSKNKGPENGSCSVQVYNRKLKHPDGCVSIERGTPYGNPFKIGRDGDREACLDKFSDYADLRLTKEPKWLEGLRGRDLLCCCKPAACHGDILIKLANR